MNYRGLIGLNGKGFNPNEEHVDIPSLNETHDKSVGASRATSKRTIFIKDASQSNFYPGTYDRYTAP